MTLHDDIQEALRRYMARTSGRYPRAVVLSAEALRELMASPRAILLMRPGRTAGCPAARAVLTYAGMRLSVNRAETSYSLSDELPLDGDPVSLQPAGDRAAPTDA
jgi:hypothetical protein